MLRAVQQRHSSSRFCLGARPDHSGYGRCRARARAVPPSRARGPCHRAPPMATRSDFAEQVEKRKRDLPEFRQRLHRLNPRNWPVHAQVDYLMLQAELDALDFRLNVIRETSKNPDFYLSQAVSRVTRHIGGRFQRAPGVTVPYDADRAAAIVQALTEIEAIVSQAPRALSGAVPELADVAIERTNGDELASISSLWVGQDRTTAADSFARTAPSSPGWSANTCPSPTPRKSAPLRSGRPRPSFSIASGFGRTALAWIPIGPVALTAFDQ